MLGCCDAEALEKATRLPFFGEGTIAGKETTELSDLCLLRLRLRGSDELVVIGDLKIGFAGGCVGFRGFDCHLY